jgi:hypothetical protein
MITSMITNMTTNMTTVLVIALVIALAGPGPVAGETLRIATYSVDLSRKGPGLLFRDILGGEDPQIAATVRVIARANPDILLLVGFDYDLTGAALAAFEQELARAATPFPYQFAARPNTGMATGLDLDRDSRRGGARDAQGYGTFAGQNGMAVLSKYPIDTTTIRDFSDYLWRDLPSADLPMQDGIAFLTEDILKIQRLPSTAHWDVPVMIPGLGRLSLLTIAATPPVFDGPEDRNGRRNGDEIRFWQHYLDGMLPFTPPRHPVVVLGKFNLDAFDSDGQHAAMQSLLAHPRLQDPQPRRAPVAGAPADENDGHTGDATLDTARFRAPPDGPGNLRVDYILPDTRLFVVDAGLLWPQGAADADIALAGRHSLIWIDVQTGD